MAGPILVAVDFSQHSRRALDAAVQLAKDHDSMIVLVHVRRAVVPERRKHVSPLEKVELEVQVGEAVELTAQWAEKVRQADIEVVVETPEGDAAEEILRAAREHKAMLIAIGTKGRGGLKRLALGSVAEAVVRRSDRPVLVVPGRRKA